MVALIPDNEHMITDQETPCCTTAGMAQRVIKKSLPALRSTGSTNTGNIHLTCIGNRAVLAAETGVQQGEAMLAEIK